MSTTTDPGVRFASMVFRWAGIYGLVVLVPLYFTEGLLGRFLPPEINHPEFYYASVGLACVFQLVFIVMGSDPLRYRPLMPIAVCEKLSYGVPCLILVAMGRSSIHILPSGLLDLTLGVLFVISYRRTAAAAKSFPGGPAV